MDKRLNKKAYTIVELLVAMSIMLVIAFISLPVANSLKKSFISEGVVISTIDAALSNARALAISEGRVFGVRFQRDKEGDQYMVFVRYIGDYENIETSRPYSFEPLKGKKPIKLPDGYAVSDLMVRDNYSNAEDYRSDPLPASMTDANFSDTTTFTVCFGKDGKLAIEKVRIFADYIMDGEEKDNIFGDYDSYLIDDSDNDGEHEEYEMVLLCSDQSPSNGFGGEQSRTVFAIFKTLDYKASEDKKEYLMNSPRYRVNIWSGSLMKTDD